jgi:hypothetical protein
MSPRTGTGSPKEASRRPRCFTLPRVVCCSAAAGAPAAPDKPKPARPARRGPAELPTPLKCVGVPPSKCWSGGAPCATSRLSAQRAPPQWVSAARVGFGKLRSTRSRRLLRPPSPAAAVAPAPAPRRPATSASRANAPPAPARVVTPGASLLLAVEVFGGSPGSAVKESQDSPPKWVFFGERAREQ